MSTVPGRTAPPTVVASAIQRVTVYESGALVSRHARVQRGEVIVPDLPLMYGQDSLRVVPSTGFVRNVHDTCTMDVDPTPESADQAALQTLELKGQLLDVAQAQNTELTTLVTGISPEKQKSLKWSTLPHYARWLEVLDAKQPILQQLRDEAVRLANERKALDQARRGLIAQAQTPAPRPSFRRGLAFALEHDADAPVDVTITYFITGATWLPSYTLHLAGERADLMLTAHVAQATGEDWSDVDLRVCTGQYHRYQRAPELVSWRIGRQQPVPRAAYRPLPPGLDDLFLRYDKAHGEHPVLQSKSPALGGARSARGGARLMRSAAPRSAARPAAAPPSLDKVFGADGSDDSEESFGFEDGGADMEDTPAAPMALAALAAPSAPPPPSRAKRASSGGAAKRRSAPSADRVGANQVQNVVEMFDAQYLRLQGPDAGQRGRLLSAQLTEHLSTLISDFDTAAHLRDLESALHAMESAANRVAHQPLPPRSIHLGQTHFRKTYTADAKASVASDGQYHRVGIKRYALGVKLEYRGVPHVEEQLYRTAVVHGAGDPLPCGPIQVYENGAYLITAAIDEARADGAVFLSLGPNPAVRVTDRSVRISQSEKGLISNKSCVDHHVEMTLRSALAYPVQAVLYGRLPEPDDNTPDVEVKLEESTLPLHVDERGPQGETVRGGFSIPVTLEPGSKLVLRYHFSITLPAKMELVGGNRRDA